MVMILMIKIIVTIINVYDDNGFDNEKGKRFDERENGLGGSQEGRRGITKGEKQTGGHPANSVVALLNVVIINPIIQVGIYGNHQHVIYSKREFFISEIST